MSADPTTLLDARLRAAMAAALGNDLPADADPLLGPSRNPDFGDFQANAAMPLGKRLGRKPRDVAEAIIEHLDVADLAEPPTVAGPGFINLTLRPDALAAGLEAMDDERLGVPASADTRTIVVDLCGVNLAKQMHVGHIRATVIGDALARIAERLGADVKRQNHFGDWGLPIAMVTASIQRSVRSGDVDLDALSLSELGVRYRAAQQAASPDRRGLAAVDRFGLGPKARAELEAQVAGAEEALAEAKATLVALQSGELEAIAIWERISDITLQACFENCRRLQVTVGPEHTAGESTYRDELAEVAEDLARRGVAEESDGALVVRLDNVGIKEPCLVRKRDGGFLYATTDLAAIRRRVQQLGARRVVYAVDARQSLHFRQVFAAARKAGYARLPDGTDAELVHAAFGTILGEDNTPFKTRGGEIVALRDLLDEAVTRAEAAVAEKNPDLEPAERRAVAEAVGIGAIKYADLSSDRVRDYVFSFDRMLAFEGNTGPYLQYAQVRVRSILRRAAEEHGVDLAALAPGASGRPTLAVGAPEEKTLALQLLRYPGVLAAAHEASEPHRLCTFLYDLASAFSVFFTACPVLRAPDAAVRDARLRLTMLTGRVLRDGLGVLGIAAPERM